MSCLSTSLFTASVIIFSLPWTEVSCLSTNVYIQHQLLSSHYHGQKCPVCPQMFIYSINYYLLITMDRSVLSVHKCLYTESIIIFSLPWTEVSCLSTKGWTHTWLIISRHCFFNSRWRCCRMEKSSGLTRSSSAPCLCSRSVIRSSAPRRASSYSYRVNSSLGYPRQHEVAAPFSPSHLPGSLMLCQCCHKGDLTPE